MNDIYEYLIEKNLPKILASPSTILHAIQQMRQISGEDPQSLLDNIQNMSIENKTQYITGRDIGGPYFKDKNFSLQQQIILESILDYMISLIIINIQHQITNQPLSKLTPILNAYEERLTKFLSEKLMCLENVPELPATVEKFDTDFDEQFFEISEAEVQASNLKRFEQVIEELVSQAKAVDDNTLEHLDSDESNPSEVSCSFWLGIWQKICEFFLWIWDKLSSISLSTSTYNP